MENIYFIRHADYGMHLAFMVVGTFTYLPQLYATLHSQGLDWQWHFGLVTFCYLIHKNRILFHPDAEKKMKYFAFHLT